MTLTLTLAAQVSDCAELLVRVCLRDNVIGIKLHLIINSVNQSVSHSQPFACSFDCTYVSYSFDGCSFVLA